MSFQESASQIWHGIINVIKSLKWKLWMNLLNRRSHKFDFIGSLTAPYRKQSLTKKLEIFWREQNYTSQTSSYQFCRKCVFLYVYNQVIIIPYHRWWTQIPKSRSSFHDCHDKAVPPQDQNMSQKWSKIIRKL